MKLTVIIVVEDGENIDRRELAVNRPGICADELTAQAKVWSIDQFSMIDRTYES